MIALTRFQSPEGAFPMTIIEMAFLFLRLDYLRVGKVRKFGIGIAFPSVTRTFWLNVEE